MGAGSFDKGIPFRILPNPARSNQNEPEQNGIDNTSSNPTLGASHFRANDQRGINTHFLAGSPFFVRNPSASSSLLINRLSNPVSPALRYSHLPSLSLWTVDFSIFSSSSFSSLFSSSSSSFPMFFFLLLLFSHFASYSSVFFIYLFTFWQVFKKSWG